MLRSEPPLTVRGTPAGVHLVGSGAGPLGGDDLHLDVAVGAGADLVVRSAAASVPLPGPHGAPSRLAVTVDVGAGASLRWLAEPTVLARGCDHEVQTRIALDLDAALVWREEVVLGRWGEATGSGSLRLVVDVAGQPLVRTELAVGPRWPGSLGPAGVDDARSVGTLLVVGATAPVVAGAVAGDQGEQVRAAALPLDLLPGMPLATLVSVVAARPSGVAAVLDRALATLDAAAAPRPPEPA